MMFPSGCAYCAMVFRRLWSSSASALAWYACTQVARPRRARTSSRQKTEARLIVLFIPHGGRAASGGAFPVVPLLTDSSYGDHGVHGCAGSARRDEPRLV